MSAVSNCSQVALRRCCPFAVQVYKFNVPTFGPGVVFDVDIKIRTEQIRFFTESLKTSKLQSYVPQFVMEAEVRPASQMNAHVADLFLASARSRESPHRGFWRVEAHRRSLAQCLSPWLLSKDISSSHSRSIRACAFQAYFAKWGDEGVVDLQEKLSELVILTASRTLMGATIAHIWAFVAWFGTVITNNVWHGCKLLYSNYPQPGCAL